MTINGTCAALTKSGDPCQGKPGVTGYCPIHNPETIAKREQERQRLEKERQAAQKQCRALREILTVMRATCKGKGWRVAAGHFDEETGQYASLEVTRDFDGGGIRDTVHGKLDITPASSLTTIYFLLALDHTIRHFWHLEKRLHIRVSWMRKPAQGKSATTRVY